MCKLSLTSIARYLFLFVYPLQQRQPSPAIVGKGLIPLKHLLVDGRAWANFEDAYLPMLDVVKAASNLQAVAANCPQRYLGLVRDALILLAAGAHSCACTRSAIMA